MFVTSEADRAGLLIASITGGRPQLQQRPTRRIMDELKAAGFQTCWVVSSLDAPDYERDAHELVEYERAWAYAYATTHWMLPEPPSPDGFLGAFPGREAACREAERRGCWGVLQLDDNIGYCHVIRNSRAGRRVCTQVGGAPWAVDVIASITLATNARMVGAQLSVVPKTETRPARPGFPYSFFVEQVGEGREPWWGPYEDDITHAIQYGHRADGATAALVPVVRYVKETKSKTGMRAHYNHERSKQLQRLIPEVTDVNVEKVRASGQGTPRVFHSMRAGAIRNPLVVKDVELWSAAVRKLADAVESWSVREKELNREKVLARAAKRLAACSGGAASGVVPESG